MKILKKNILAKSIFIVPWPEKKISNKEYEHVPNVWNTFETKTMKDYHNLHLKCELLFWTDVFEKIRNSSLKNYGLKLEKSCAWNYFRSWHEYILGKR